MIRNLECQICWQGVLNGEASHAGLHCGWGLTVAVGQKSQCNSTEVVDERWDGLLPADMSCDDRQHSKKIVGHAAYDLCAIE